MINTPVTDSSQLSDLDKIIFTNKYYPNGITKNMLINYYTVNARRILNECGKRPVVLFFSFEPNEPLVIRRNINGSPIILYPKIYDKLVGSGNVISIAAEVPDRTNFWVIDIDCKTMDNSKYKAEAVDDIISLMEPYIKFYKVYNSTTGFHIYGYLVKKVNRSIQRGLVERLLEDKLSGKYRIDGQILDKSVEHENINLDLSSMNQRGSILVPNSLSREGIICKDVTNSYKKWNWRKGIIS